MFNNQRNIDMCNGKILGPLIAFSLPIMFTGLLQLLYNAADIIVVGNFAGDASVAAVSSTGALTNLLVNFFMGLSVGASVVISRAYGARDSRMVFESVHTAAVLAALSGVAVAVGGFFTAKPLLQLMGSPADVIDLSTLYLKIIFLGMPANMVYNFFAAILRAVGDSRRPLIFLAISGLINVALNLLFIIVFHMTVDGVALATIISQYISAAMITVCLLRSSGSYKLHLREIRIYRCAGEMLRIGLPAGLQSSLFSLSNILIQSSINSFGKIAMAGSGAAASIEGFVYTAMNSIAQATTTYTAQNVGARRFDRLNKINLYALTAAAVTGVSLGALVNIFGRPLLNLYISDATAIGYGIERLRWICLPYLLCGMMDVQANHLRGMGCSLMPTVTSLIGVCALRVFWVSAIFAIHRSLAVLYLSYPVSWTIVFIVNAITTVVVTHNLKKRA
ncbi:MAG: MATE family efflux transporter [Firmicutes bacterium]|nr:MATE family efflux transporter [Bacillota bacterium]